MRQSLSNPTLTWRWTSESFGSCTHLFSAGISHETPRIRGGEVGEKVVEAHLYSMLDQVFTQLRFPGIPYGHDVRFLTDRAFVQIDVKSTGPTDNPNEIVASPNQVTGDGLFVKGLVQNSLQKVRGQRRKMKFRPELSPFISLGNTIYPVATFYVKVIYTAPSKGNQPLEYLELVCVPNGLLMFDGPKFHANTKGLLIPGKDETDVKRKRTRIRLDPLATLARWRCIRLTPHDGTCDLSFRGSDEPVQLRPRTAATSSSPLPS
jgi:Restriction endonuclease BglI